MTAADSHAYLFDVDFDAAKLHEVVASNSSSIRVYLHFFSFTNCTIHHSTSHRNRWTSTIYLKYALCYLPKNRYSPSSGFIPKIYFVWLNKFTYIRLKINRHKCAGDFLSEILKNPAHETFLRFFNSIRFRCGENSLIFILLLLFFSYKSDRWHMIKCMFSLLPIHIHNESVTIHNFTQFTQLSIRIFFYVNKKCVENKFKYLIREIVTKIIHRTETRVICRRRCRLSEKSIQISARIMINWCDENLKLHSMFEHSDVRFGL